MWFGSYDGVNCFDGRDIEVFRADFSQSSTLDNNVILGIDRADGNDLWITSQTGINRFSRTERRVVSNYSRMANGHLCSNSAGNTWLVGSDSVAYYDTGLRRFVGLDKFGVTVRNPEARAFVTGDGELWIFPDSAASGELCKVSVGAFGHGAAEAAGNISRVNFHPLNIENIFYQDDKSFCFIDSEKNLYLYDLWRQTKVYIRNISPLLAKYGAIVGIVPYYEDLMIAFRTNGLVQLKATESYREVMIDRNLRIFCLYKDSEQGILWIGVDGRGAMMYAKRHSIATNLMTQHLSPNFTRQVRSVMTDRHGGLWFGTKGDGLVHIKEYDKGMSADNAVVFFPGKRQTAQAYMREDTEFSVFSLRESHYMNGFWIGSGSAGLFYHLFGDTCLRHLDVPSGRQIEEVHEVHEANDTTLYLATSNGFHRFVLDRPADRSGGRIAVRHTQSYRFFHEQQEISTFFSMIPEGDSVLWLGSRDRGLVRFAVSTGDYWVFSLKALLGKSVDDVLCIHRMKTGDMLVGTTSGLVRLHFTGKKIDARYAGREQGLLNDMIHGILEDADGFVWLSTNKGLIKYDPVNGSFHAYYYSGDVQIGEFSDDAYYECPYSGRLFFGGMDGLLYLERSSSDDFSYYPDILLRRLSFGHNRANLADHMTGEGTLKFRDTDGEFTLAFAVPDYISASNIEYSWMLDGYDKEWSQFGANNEATYADVPAGNYVFRARYRKDVFDTKSRSIAIPILILPLWYRTLLARLLFAVLLGAAALFVSVVLCRSVRHKRTIEKLLRIEGGNTSDAGPAGHNRKIVAGLTSIYRACDRWQCGSPDLRQNDVPGFVQEIVLSLLLPADLSVGANVEIPPPLARFTVTGQLRVKDISDEVAYQLMKRGIDLSNIESNIPDDLCFPVYRNAFRLLFNYIYLFAADARRFSLSASQTDERLLLSLRGSKERLERLCKCLTDEYYDAPAASPERDAVFGMQLLRQLVMNMMKQMQPAVVLSETELCVSFPPAEVCGQPAGPDRKVVLLLEDHDEMGWQISEILSGAYDVRRVRSIRQAIEFIEAAPPVAFLVDMMMYTEAENSFIEFFERSDTLLSRTAFVLLFTWGGVSSVRRDLIVAADGLVVLPYDIVFLHEIVCRAIYGRADAKQVRIGGLSENLAGLVTCTTGEQAEFVRRMVTIIEQNIDRENLGSSFIAERMAMSSRKFYRKFKEISSYPPAEFIKNYRLEKAASLLAGNIPIKDVIAEIGIASRSYLYREFVAKYGMSPSDYRSLYGKKSI